MRPVPHARYSTYRGVWPALLAPLRVWKEGELGGGPAGTVRLPNTFGLPRSGASPPLEPFRFWGGRSLRPPNAGWGALRCSGVSLNGRLFSLGFPRVLRVRLRA